MPRFHSETWRFPSFSVPHLAHRVECAFYTKVGLLAALPSQGHASRSQPQGAGLAPLAAAPAGTCGQVPRLALTGVPCVRLHGVRVRQLQGRGGLDARGERGCCCWRRVYAPGPTLLFMRFVHNPALTRSSVEVGAHARAPTPPHLFKHALQGVGGHAGEARSDLQQAVPHPLQVQQTEARADMMGECGSAFTCAAWKGSLLICPSTCHVRPCTCQP